MNEENQSQPNTEPTVPTPQAPVSAVPTTKSATSADAFRKASRKRTEGEAVELSSGNVLIISRPSINALVKTNQLPSELANSAIKVQSGGNFTDHDMKKYVEYNERIVRIAVKSPAIVDSPRDGENEISIDDLSDDERNEVLLYVNGGLDALAKFRSDRSSILARPDMS